MFEGFFKKKRLSTIMVCSLVFLWVMQMELFSASTVNEDSHIVCLSVSCNYLLPEDESYKEVYADSAIVPDLELDVKVFSNLFGWVGGGMMSAQGETSVLKDQTTSSQTFLSGGLGAQFGDSILFKIQAGGLLVMYKEDAMGLSVSGNAMGFMARGGVLIKIMKNFGFTIHLDYLSARKTIENQVIKFGGMQAGAGISILF